LSGGRALDVAAQAMFCGDAKTLFDKYTEGDAAAAEFLELWKERLTSTIAFVVQVIAPETVVLGGSVMTCQPWLTDAIRLGTKSKLFGKLPDKLNFELCAHGADEGLFGAAYYAKHSFLESELKIPE
jgi:glucokinase